MKNHLVLEIGCISINFTFHNAKLFNASKRRYKRFIVGKKQNCYSVCLKNYHSGVGQATRLRAPEGALQVLLSGEQSPKRSGAGRGLKVDFADSSLNIKRDDFRSVINLEKKHGNAYIANRINSFETFLRILYSCLLLNKNGMLIHASGIITKNGKEAIIFPGISGAGKSTIVRHSPRKKVLNDEILGITFAGGMIYVFSTPFWGSGGQSLRGIEPQKFYALKAVLFPEKALKIFFKDAVPGYTIKRILRCALNFVKQKEYSIKLLSHAVQIATSLSAKKFCFYPDKKLYNIIGSL